MGYNSRVVCPAGWWCERYIAGYQIVTTQFRTCPLGFLNLGQRNEAWLAEIVGVIKEIMGLQEVAETL